MLKVIFSAETKMNFIARIRMNKILEKLKSLLLNYKNVDFIQKLIVWLPSGSVIALGLYKGQLDVTLIGLSLLITVHQINQLEKKINNSCWY